MIVASFHMPAGYLVIFICEVTLQIFTCFYIEIFVFCLLISVYSLYILNAILRMLCNYFQ